MKQTYCAVAIDLGNGIFNIRSDILHYYNCLLQLCILYMSPLYINMFLYFNISLFYISYFT